MQVLKFGGTSVGSAERMKEVAKLITNNERKIVVLSAMSGTTNNLVKITEFLYSQKKESANNLIDFLEENYNKVINELYTNKKSLQEGKELITTHFNYIRSLTQDVFTIHEEKAILAQGELISTALFHIYLKEH